MRTRFVYWGVLGLVLSAWFGNSSVKKIVTQAPEARPTKVEAAVRDPKALGVVTDKFIVQDKCNIEYANGSPVTTATFRVRKDVPLKLVGWAMDMEKSKLPESVIIRMDGGVGGIFYAQAKAGYLRSDVVEYFHVPESLALSGYETNINLKGLPEGEYSLVLIMRFGDVIAICDNGRKMSVRE